MPGMGTVTYSRGCVCKDAKNKDCCGEQETTDADNNMFLKIDKFQLQRFDRCLNVSKGPLLNFIQQANNQLEELAAALKMQQHGMIWRGQLK